MRSPHAPRPRAARRALTPRPELLEDRKLLSTLTVRNGPGSLRQAVLAANANPGPDTIVFDRSVHRIALTGGELAVADVLEVRGPGAARLTVSGGGVSRVFDVLPGATATVAGLTVADGRAGGDAPGYPSTGGGVLNRGTLTLDGVAVSGNRTIGDPAAIVAVNAVFQIAGGAVGGGLANFGTLNLNDSTVAGNLARGADDVDASSLPFFAFPGNALGGGLANFGVTGITGSQFAGNQALAGSRGIGAFAAIGGGGAILNDASLDVDDTLFQDNRAVGGDDSHSPSHNGHALGGAIMSGSLTALGGAVGADLTVSRSLFRRNQALGGNNNRIDDPAPPSEAPNNAYGGAILVYQGTAAIHSTTVMLNRAVAGVGPSLGDRARLGIGGGIFFYNFVGGVTATLDQSTVVNNAAIGGAGSAGVSGGDGLGGGVAVGGLGSPFGGPGSVTIRGTTIARNLAQGGVSGPGTDGGDGQGGGLYSDGSSTLVLGGNAIVHNRARGGRGRAGGRPGQGNEAKFSND